MASWLVHLADFHPAAGWNGPTSTRICGHGEVWYRYSITSVLTSLLTSQTTREAVDSRAEQLRDFEQVLRPTACHSHDVSTVNGHSTMIQCPSNPNDTFNVKQESTSFFVFSFSSFPIVPKKSQAPAPCFLLFRFTCAPTACS